MSTSHNRVQPGGVVSIGRHSGYRPDFKGLASGQVRAAREKLGLGHAEFASYLVQVLGWAVTAEAVERWERGAIPPGDVLLASAAAAQEVPGDILTLPLSAGAGRRAALVSAIGPALDTIGDSSESVTPYADRGLITRAQWNGIIRGSVSQLWLSGMAEFGYATDHEVSGIVQEAAADACEIRVLLLDPGYAAAAEIDADEGSPPGTLVSRIRAALARFTQMREAAGGRMQVRTYDTHPSVSVVRGDDRMFVTPYLRFFVGSNSPTFEIASDAAPRMFSRYARHFDGMWKLAKEWP